MARTAVGAAGGSGDFWKALGIAVAGYSVLHAINTKQFQGWHAVGLTIGLISALS